MKRKRETFPNLETLGRPGHILLVEDNAADVRLTQEAMRNGTGIRATLHVVKDGEEALDFLYQRGRFTEAPRPDVILLDLNLPGKDGRQVLKEIKGDSSLLSIPVIVLSTSSSTDDVDHSYSLHANCYITKPVEFDEFQDIVRQIKECWLGVVRLPSSVAA
jgi:CheY-like chemotaxis protein